MNKVCEICGIQFAHKQSYSLHRKTHGEEDQVECQQENCVYKGTKANLGRHMKNLHSGREFNCENCEMVLTQHFNLKRHVKQIHETESLNC